MEREKKKKEGKRSGGYALQDANLTYPSLVRPPRFAFFTPACCTYTNAGFSVITYSSAAGANGEGESATLSSSGEVAKAVEGESATLSSCGGVAKAVERRRR